MSDNLPSHLLLLRSSKQQKFVEDKTDDECEEVDLQHREISKSECADCFGQWKDNETEEWLKCTNNKCGVWSHTECLEMTMDNNIMFDEMVFVLVTEIYVFWIQ